MIQRSKTLLRMLYTVTCKYESNSFSKLHQGMRVSVIAAGDQKLGDMRKGHKRMHHRSNCSLQKKGGLLDLLKMR